MPRGHYGAPFYMIIIDKDNGTFSVEGPMTGDKHWNHAVVEATRRSSDETATRSAPP